MQLAPSTLPLGRRGVNPVEMAKHVEPIAEFWRTGVQNAPAPPTKQKDVFGLLFFLCLKFHGHDPCRPPDSKTPCRSRASCHFRSVRAMARLPQAKVRKRCSSAMKAFSPNSPSWEPNGICARSFQDAGTFQVRATASSTTGL